MTQDTNRDNTAKSLYESLSPKREPYLTRARQCAELTIPSLMPPAGHTGSSELYTPFQSIGARGVNNLASKLLLSLLPPNSPFFRLMVDDYTLAEQFDEDGRAEFEEALNDVERAVMTESERRALRTPVFTALKQVITAGNVLLLLPKEGRPRAVRFDSYVVRRSPDGVVLDVVIKEEIAYGALPPEIRKKLDEQPDAEKYDPEDTVEVYTHFYLKGQKYHQYQEVEGLTVPGSKGSYNKDEPPFLALRWTHLDGEDYGRGHVEEYIGDLNALEGLSKSILETSLAAAKSIIMVRPNSTTRIQKVIEANNLDVIQGNEDDVSVIQLEKRADLSVAQSTMGEIMQRMAHAFLLNSSVQRDAERVTAEEIRFMAAELEDALGGVYSLLSQEFQLPLVKRLISLMEREDRIPTLPDGIEPSIVTGLEALGRGHDLSKYQVLSSEIAKFGPETIDEYLNLADYFKRFGTGLGIDMDGLIRSQEEREQRKQERREEMQQQQMAEIASKAAGPAAQAAMKESSQ